MVTAWSSKGQRNRGRIWPVLPREGCSKVCKEKSTSDMPPPPHLLGAWEAYLALQAWGWAAHCHQGTGPGPAEPLWTSSSSASCRSHSTGWPPGCRSARGTGSRGASAAGCPPSRGRTPPPAPRCPARPAAAPGHTELPVPWWVTQTLTSYQLGPHCPFFVAPASYFRDTAPQQLQRWCSQPTSCPPRHCLSSFFRNFCLLTCP